MQKTEYLYNIRGWMTRVNDPQNTTTENDIFALQLQYNDALNMVKGQLQYNGNVSAIEWVTNRPEEKFAYRFLYDKLNRMTTGEFYRDDHCGYMQEDSYNEKNITYDANGNMIRDYNKSITSAIVYSYLNKPELIDFGNEEKTNYIYDGAGNNLAFE